MVGVGNYLRLAREEQGYTIEEMTELTNIDLKYLQALENEEFDILPSPFYVQTFLRSYAKYLNLSMDTVIQLYESSQKPDEEPIPDEPKTDEMLELPRRSSSPKNRISSLWLIVAIILILGIVYMIFQ